MKGNKTWTEWMSRLLIVAMSLLLFVNIVKPQIDNPPPYYYYDNGGLSIQTALNDSTYYGDQITCTKDGKELNCDDGNEYELKQQKEDSGWQLWANIAASIGIVLFAGLMSGLTMGLMSLDLMNLKIVQKSGSPAARKHATVIMPLVEKHHLLLVTLLIGNSLAMEALPIFLDRIIGSIGAILVSVTMVLLFGEIIPQAICTRYGLAIGANLAWLVWILIFVFFIVAWPVSKLLDWLLGTDHGTVYRRAELKELVDIHEKVCHIHGHEDETDSGDSLTQQEVGIIKQVLDFKTQKVESLLVPIREVMMVAYQDILDVEYFLKLLSTGKTKWPVYMKKKDNIIGILTVPVILEANIHENPSVGNLPLLRPPVIHQLLNINDVLSLFHKSACKMAIVVDHFDCVTILGIITLSDILQHLWGKGNSSMRELSIHKVEKQVKEVRKMSADTSLIKF